ncbi:MAG: MATE family efflux transporter [Actinomycetota bacterium]
MPSVRMLAVVIPLSAHRIRAPGRHKDDRTILALAVPALGALAADPLYSLVDTAYVGHLGTPQLGAVAVGTAAFTASFWLFSFLAYGVTPRVAAALGAGDDDSATRIGVQAILLAVVLGLAVTILGSLFASPIVRALGARDSVEHYAESYLRIRILAATPVLLAQVGHGWLRGAHDTRSAMIIAVSGALANVVIGYLLIFTAGWGIEGAAWAVVVCQTTAAAGFVIVLKRRMVGARWRWDYGSARTLLTVGSALAVRTGSLLAALTVATAVATRMGEVEVASWQITMQLFLFLALTLDAVAIAAQAMVGRTLGSPDPPRAVSNSTRLMEWGIGLGLLLAALLLPLARPIAGVFSDDPLVVAATTDLLIWLALLQPLAGAAFTLDGILIGAADAAFLAASMAASSALFVGLAIAALAFQWGTAGLAAGLSIWMIARTATTAARFAGRRWIRRLAGGPDRG